MTVEILHIIAKVFAKDLFQKHAQKQGVDGLYYGLDGCPRALPWADIYGPFRAKGCLYSVVLLIFAAYIYIAIMLSMNIKEFIW